MQSSLTVVNGASYIKVSKVNKKKAELKEEMKDKKVDQKVNNKRGSVISTFSKEARRNMMYTLARVRRDCLPCFVTLTYPAVYNTDPKAWKKDLHDFTMRLARKSAFEDVAGIWKLEPQRRGAPHYHLLLWNVSLEDLRAYVPKAWNEIVASGDLEHLRWHRGDLSNVHCVQPVMTQKAMYQYVTKYISKAALEDWKNVGKWWGMLWKNRIPFGEEVVFEITEGNANDIIRYMRRYTKMGGGLALQSRQQVCDADQWMEKLQTRSMGTFADWLQLPQVQEAGRNDGV